MGMVVQTQTQPFYWTTNGSRFYQYQHKITYKTKLPSIMRFFILSGEVFLRGFGDLTNLACNRQPELSCEMDICGCDKFWVRKRLIVVASADSRRIFGRKCKYFIWYNLNLYVWLCNMFTKYANHQKGPRVQSSFVPEASFGLRVLSLPAYVCVCVCLFVCLCVNHLLVRAITRDPFKLGSPNLDQRCKIPWLISLLFWWAIDLDLHGQI